MVTAIFALAQTQADATEALGVQCGVKPHKTKSCGTQTWPIPSRPGQVAISRPAVKLASYVFEESGRPTEREPTAVPSPCVDSAAVGADRVVVRRKIKIVSRRRKEIIKDQCGNSKKVCDTNSNEVEILASEDKEDPFFVSVKDIILERLRLWDCNLKK